MSRRERLSALDASFLYIESKTAPNHGALLSLVDGPIDFDAMRKDFRQKLPLLPRLTQVIRHVPLNLAHPSWEPASDFNLDDHLHHIHLARPESVDYARRLAVEIFHRGMDKSKPLWAMYAVTGLEGNRSAVIYTSHHCMIDGGSGLLVSKILFGAEGLEFADHLKPQARKEAPQGFLPMLTDALAENASGLAALVARSPRSTVTACRALMSPAFRTGRKAMREYRKAPGLKFPFNARLSGRIEFVTGTFPFPEIRMIGGALGGTVNDVLLAVVTGAMRTYANECGLDVTGKYFKFQIPVNVRRPDQRGIMGNFAAPMPVHVPLDIDDPIARVRAVVDRTRTVKELNLATGISQAIQIAQTLLTPPGLAFVERIYGWTWLRGVIATLQSQPSSNMFVTNMPGRREPLYIDGHRALTRHILVPLLPNNGVVCGALSYDSKLEVSYTGDAALRPGVDALMQYTQDAFDELLEHARNAYEASGTPSTDAFRTADAG